VGLSCRYLFGCTGLPRFGVTGKALFFGGLVGRVNCSSVFTPMQVRDKTSSPSMSRLDSRELCDSLVVLELAEHGVAATVKDATYFASRMAVVSN
jgi:hypothetical protein